MTAGPRALRPLAIQRDVETATAFELGALWENSRNGSWTYSDTFSTHERCYAIVRARTVPRALNPRKLRVLESMLLGTQPKVVAFEHRRSLSSVSTDAQECLRDLGLDCKGSHASLILIMAATARLRDESARLRGRLSRLQVDDQEYLVVSARRPDLEFPVKLSMAEAAVLRSLVDGSSHAEISGQRERSTRTVANQLATAFRKLGVSGRRATIARLLQHSAQPA